MHHMHFSNLRIGTPFQLVVTEPPNSVLIKRLSHEMIWAFRHTYIHTYMSE
jgi:hypothetical protein